MNHLANENIFDIKPYKPGKPIEELKRELNLEHVIKLASNENPNPVPENVKEVIKKELQNLNIYPDSDSYYLKKKIAEFNNVDFENVIIGAGSVELIKSIIRLFLKPGEKVLTSEKTFLMYKIATIETASLESYVEVKMTDDYKFNLQGFLEKIDDKTKVIFITNPNNPTGTMLGYKEIEDFINKIPEDKIIVLDNAYDEYVVDRENYFDGIKESISRKNLIVLRTFSKIYSLAALRVGYAISNKEIISLMNRLRAPFNITTLSQKAAELSLDNKDFKKMSVEMNTKNRTKLFNQLKSLGLEVIPSETNFLMFIPPMDIYELHEKLLKRGIIIRPLKAFGVDNAMRVTIGLEHDNDQFFNALKDILNK